MTGCSEVQACHPKLQPQPSQQVRSAAASTAVDLDALEALAGAATDVELACGAAPRPLGRGEALSSHPHPPLPLHPTLCFQHGAAILCVGAGVIMRSTLRFARPSPTGSGPRVRDIPVLRVDDAPFVSVIVPHWGGGSPPWGGSQPTGPPHPGGVYIHTFRVSHQAPAYALLSHCLSKVHARVKDVSALRDHREGGVQLSCRPQVLSCTSRCSSSCRA